MIVRVAQLFLGLLFLPFAFLAGCGDGSSPPSGATSAQHEAAAGVEVTGNVGRNAAAGSILVFAMSGSEEPVSVGLIGDDGGFTLSALPVGPLELVFLDDKASDGVIDQGDPVAKLADPSFRLLQEGDRVQVTDVQLDFRAGRAVAARVEVVHAGGGEEAPVAATPTPIP